MKRINLTKKDLINSIYMQIGFSKRISENLLEDVLDTIINNLKKNKKLKISKFGTFSVRNKKKKNWANANNARFVCCITLFWPNGKFVSKTCKIVGRISNSKKGKNGFGYDPIFVPNGYKKTFGEMDIELKMSIDHRFKAFKKIKFFFT